MKTRTIFLAILVFLLVSPAFAQHRANSNRPPWVTGKGNSFGMGKLPDIQLEGNILEFYKGSGKSKETAREQAFYKLVEKQVGAEGAAIGLSKKREKVVDKQIIDKVMHEQLTSRTKQSITIDGKTVARYAIIDEYYEYAAGEWHYAGLFLVAEEGMTLAHVPPITYGVDHGAWRSLILPGWAQLYQRRTTAGIGYMAVQAGLIGSTIYFNNLASYYKKRQGEAFSINAKQDYKKRYDQTNILRNISAGVCAAWYVLNVVDAFTSQRGRLYYTTSYRDTRFSLAPTIVPDVETPVLGLACTIKF